MAHITLAEAKTWTEPTKVGVEFAALEGALEDQVASQIFARLGQRFSTISWLDETSTPKLVRSIIAMYYTAWMYDRTYSTDEEVSAYAALLREMADRNIEGLLGGIIDLPEVPETNQNDQPVFFPNDLSSSQCPTEDNPSDGGPAFLMGTVW